jgi:hypothetical protein
MSSHWFVVVSASLWLNWHCMDPDLSLRVFVPLRTFSQQIVN